MGEKLYGVDLEEDVTPKKVRDAIIQCFKEAHTSDVQEHVDVSEEDAEKINESIVKKAFEMAGADYENPSKGDMKAVCDQLALIAKNFRNPGVIKKHYGNIMKLVELIK